MTDLTSPTDPIIEVRDLGVTYTTAEGRTVQALDGIDLQVRPGEFVSLIGPSGCGKSSLLHVIGGMRTATVGQVRMEGDVVAGPRPDRAAFVFQDYSLYPWRNVLDNVGIGMQFRGVPARKRAAAARRYLDLVGLGSFAQSYPRELSGGMQQRVAIARALAMEPDILLMDEPFGALDEQTRTELGEELLRILEGTSKTIVFVTHSLAEAVYLSDRIVVLSAHPGRVVDTITVEEERPRQASFMTSAHFEEARTRLFEMLHAEVRRAAVAREESS